MSQQNQSMLIFTLGPVQSFIMQARKTRDLWLGSFLLSKLMEAAMKDIAGEFVFPTNREIKENIPDLPNKYIALFNSPDDAQRAAKKSKKQIADLWDKIQQDVWQKIIQTNKGLEPAEILAAERIWKRQSNPNTFFEIMWVVVEKRGDEKYKDWLDRTQKALDARKRLRDFSPQLENEPGDKSTVSGEREALRGTGISRAQVRAFWAKLTKGLSAKDIGHEGSERLDAIDTIKRFATKSPVITEQPFPSTSSIATASFVQKLLAAEIPDSILQAWQQATGKQLMVTAPKAIPYLKEHAGNREWILRRDGDIYFPEAFTPRYLKENYEITNNINDIRDQPRLIFKDENFIPNNIAALKALISAVGAQPTPYYAVIQMDGDNMGTLLSGVRDKDEHIVISRALSEFSREKALQVIENDRPARLVYAGGDDVLALSPLEGLLNSVNSLQRVYSDEVREAVVGDDRKTQVTASIGIAIAHHFTPLSFVLRTARESEHLAKEHYGRNALAVNVIRNSGEQTRVGCQWHYEKVTDNEMLAEDAQPIALFNRFYEFFKQDILSPKCVHILLDEASTLVWLDREAQASEIKRILKRQRSESKKDELPDKTNKEKKGIEELAAHLANLSTAMDKLTDEKHKFEKEFKKSTELHSEKPRYGLIEVLGWLLVMAFLAGKEQD